MILLFNVRRGERFAHLRAKRADQFVCVSSARVLTDQRRCEGWREGCRIGWRAHCPTEREGGISSERDRQTVFLDTRRDYISMNRADGLFGKRREPDIRGSCAAGAGVGAALNIITLVSEKSEHPLMPSFAPELSFSGGRGCLPHGVHAVSLRRSEDKAVAGCASLSATAHPGGRAHRVAETGC
jgi:hypothetical protein